MGLPTARENSDNAIDLQTSGGGRERWGGARADFVSNLGRRVAELSLALTRLSSPNDAKLGRDELKRRLHGLCSSAKLLHFTRLAGEVEPHLTRITRDEALTQHEIQAMRDLFSGLPALALEEATVSTPDALLWENAALEASANSKRDLLTIPTGPVAVLVVGSHSIVDALTLSVNDSNDSKSARRLDVEHVDGFDTALEAARAIAPDLIVVDADRPSALEATHLLLSDSITEGIPVLVLGRFASMEEAAPYVAKGVARTISKPISPAALQRACVELATRYVTRDSRPLPLGEVTLDELVVRMCDELKRGLCDGAEPKARQSRIDLGDGSELMAAIWGAVARARDVLTMRSEGEIRFMPNGPEGAFPMAPWLREEEARALRSQRGNEVRLSISHSLQGVKVLIADDDPAITWFLAGVLRSAGATVFEADNGQKALELAFHHAPDVVVSDVLMPKLDGFALCRALKRDLVLRDVPVILLSWKEDLLQRVRELGAYADGYMRKEASGSVIVQRVCEVLRPRQSIAARLSKGGEVRGRLDGLTTHTLLLLCASLRPTSRLSVRDSHHLYEVDFVRGRPLRIARSSDSGAHVEGTRVLSSLLSVGAGRFAVTDLEEPEAIQAHLDLTLEELMLSPVASARAAQRLLSHTGLMQADRIEFESDWLSSMVGCIPESLRSILNALQRGTSPRALVTNGETSARNVEDALSDCAAQGKVEAIYDAHGENILPAAILRELELLRSGAMPTLTPAPPRVNGLLTRTPPPVQVLDQADLVEESMHPAPVRPEPIALSFTPPVVQAASVNATTVETPRVIAPDEMPLPSYYAGKPRRREKKRSKVSVSTWILFALVGVGASLVVRRWTHEDAPTPAVTQPAAEVKAAVVTPPAKPQVEEVALPRGEQKIGEGVLEVVADERDSVMIDQKPQGTGTTKLTLAARNQPYEVRVKAKGEEQSHTVNVREGKMVRVRFAPASR